MFLLMVLKNDRCQESSDKCCKSQRRRQSHAPRAAADEIHRRARRYFIVKLPTMETAFIT